MEIMIHPIVCRVVVKLDELLLIYVQCLAEFPAQHEHSVTVIVSGRIAQLLSLTETLNVNS